MGVNRGSIICERAWKSAAVLTLTCLWTGCVTRDFQLARDLFPRAANIQTYDIRQFRMGLAPGDAVTILVDTLEGEYSADLEKEVVSCVRSGFDQANLSAVPIVSPEEFRRSTFPDTTADQMLSEPWEQRLVDPGVRERIASLGLRYLIAATVSEGKSLTEPAEAYWKWQRFAVMSATVVDLTHTHVAGKMTASVRKTSAAGFIHLHTVFGTIAAPVPFVVPSFFVEEKSCNEFGIALANFLMSQETPPQIVMSSLTLDNLFPQHLGRNNTIVLENMAPKPKSLTALLSGSNEMAVYAEPRGISASSTPAKEKFQAETGISRWEEIRPLMVRKELIVHEDPNAQWPSKGAGFQNAFCYEIKLSLNTVMLNTKELPPLPSRWHLAPVWIAKLVSLPIQMAIPMVAIATAPLNPQAAVLGLETLYNCLPNRQDDREEGHDNSTSAHGNPIANSARPVTLDSTTPTESIFEPQAHHSVDIHTAAETGDVGKVRSLLKENKQLVNAKDHAALTPLHLAAVNGRTAVVEVLLANNADVNPRDWQGATPLKLAAMNGYRDIVDLLREHGAKD